MVYQLIYSSAVCAGVSDDAIIEIARDAQKKNIEIGITGMMLCHQGSILQVLEGAKSVVENLYEKIVADNRHTQILRLINREADMREFGNWAMGFKHIPNTVSDPTLAPLIAKTYNEILPENASRVLMSINQSFARVNEIDIYSR